MTQLLFHIQINDLNHNCLLRLCNATIWTYVNFEKKILWFTLDISPKKNHYKQTKSAEDNVEYPAIVNYEIKKLNFVKPTINTS